MKRRRHGPSGPPTRPRVAECGPCGAQIGWLPFTADCPRAHLCYAAWKRPADCPRRQIAEAQREGYCGLCDGPVQTTRVRLAGWASGPVPPGHAVAHGWTVDGLNVKGYLLADDEPSPGQEYSALLPHACDPVRVLERKMARGRGPVDEDDRAAARGWAEMRSGGQDRAAGED